MALLSTSITWAIIPDYYINTVKRRDISIRLDGLEINENNHMYEYLVTR